MHPPWQAKLTIWSNMQLLYVNPQFNMIWLQWMEWTENWCATTNTRIGRNHKFQIYDNCHCSAKEPNILQKKLPRHAVYGHRGKTSQGSNNTMMLTSHSFKTSWCKLVTASNTSCPQDHGWFFSRTQLEPNSHTN